MPGTIVLRSDKDTSGKEYFDFYSTPDPIGPHTEVISFVILSTENRSSSEIRISTAMQNNGPLRGTLDLNPENHSAKWVMLNVHNADTTQTFDLQCR